MKTLLAVELAPRFRPEETKEVLKAEAARLLRIAPEDIVDLTIRKCSIDARKKPAVKLLYSILIELKDGAIPLSKIQPPPVGEGWQVPDGKGAPTGPLVVGSGPAGLFAALVFAEAGLRPVVLERGRSVEERKKDIGLFFQTRSVNPESNFLFGEGGAGTWSDGKLFTRTRDIRSDYVMKAFAEAGAGEEILYLAHPHIGSDRLPEVVRNIREKICRLGGRFLWNTRVEDVTIRNGKAASLSLAGGQSAEGPCCIMACGHSARELILRLTEKAAFSMKGFQIGCRIEHEQRFINRIRYGVEVPPPVLGSAEYLYSSRPGNGTPGATTFCMCPGGEIIPAVCEEGHLSTNGMSRRARDGRFADSAIVSTVPDGLFPTPREAFDFIASLEKGVFRQGGGDYTAPAQSARGFLEGKAVLSRTASSYRFGLQNARLDQLVPEFTREAIRGALRHFESQAHGFLNGGMLIGMETHVSSPVRFLRDPETLCSLSAENLYLCGEGGGTAGGIISAAVDGVKAAEQAILHLCRIH